MTTTHTPGPWTLGDEDNPLVFSPAAGAYVAQVLAYTYGDIGTLRAGVDADARLIAAAPDLLAALRLCHRFINGGHGLYPGLHHEAYVAARDAIARATGGAA